MPYEISALSTEHNDIGTEYHIRARFDENIGTRMATYSSQEKVDKVMVMLREYYAYFEKCKINTRYADDEPAFFFKFPQDSEV
jgi:hypothetical protein